MDRKKEMTEDVARARIAVALAAGACGVSPDEVMSAGRALAVVLARQVAMYVASVAWGMSLGRVARAFGRDRATVRHACSMMEERREDARFDRWIEAIESAAANTPVMA